MNLLKCPSCGTKDAVFQKAVHALQEFSARFGAEPSRSFVAELYAAGHYGLTLREGRTDKGFDGVDAAGVRYQVKSRAAQNVDFNNFDFDIAVLVELSPCYEVVGLWRLEVDEVKRLSTCRQNHRKWQMTTRMFKRRAEELSQRDL